MFTLNMYNVTLSNVKRLLKFSNVIFKETLLKFPISNRKLSTTNIMRYKIFKEMENITFRNYLKASGKYNIYTNTDPETHITEEEYSAIMKDNWNGRTPEELHLAFVKLSDYACKNKIAITLQEFDGLIDNLTDNMEKMEDEQLRSLSYHLEKWPSAPSVFTRNFVEIWAALDDIYMRRLHTWDFDTALLHADCMYTLNLSKKCDYVLKVINKGGRSHEKISASQFVQTMLYVCATRIKPVNKIDFEIKFDQILDSLTMIETAIVCAGFFKSKCVLVDKALISKLMDKLASHLSTTDDLTFNCILKSIRSSLNHKNLDTMEKLLDQIVPYIPKFNLTSCVQVATLPVVLNFYHPKSLNLILEKFMSNPSAARIKDIERLTLPFTEFRHKDNSLYEFIVEQLRKPELREEILKYPRSYAICLSYLCRVEVLPEDMISEVLDPNFVKTNYSIVHGGRIDEKNPIGKELLYLDCYSEIELPNYTGNRLSTKVLTNLSRFFTNWMPDNSGKFRQTYLDKIYMSLQLALEKYFGGSEYVKGYHILPNFDKGVYIASMDAQGNPVDITSFMESLKFGQVIRPPKDSNKWYAFVLLTRSSYICNTLEISAVIKMELRQLKKIGYTPILINTKQWISLEEKQRMHFIKNSLRDREVAETEKLYLISSQ